MFLAFRITTANCVKKESPLTNNKSAIFTIQQITYISNVPPTKNKYQMFPVQI